MKIDIGQSGNHYKFFKNNSQDHYLTGKWVSGFFKSVYSEIYDGDQNKVATIRFGKSAGTWWKKKINYEFEFYKEQQVITVTVLNRWKGHWAFEFNGEKYDFYFHRGHRKSLYKEDQQMAKFNKRTTNLWEYDKGFIIADNDANDLMLICLFLAYDMGETNDADISVDMGNLLEGVKEYDDRWIPK